MLSTPSLRLAALLVMMALVVPGPVKAEPPVEIPPYILYRQELGDLEIMRWVSAETLETPDELPEPWPASARRTLDEAIDNALEAGECLALEFERITPPGPPPPRRTPLERLASPPIVLIGELVARTPGLSLRGEALPYELVTLRVKELLAERPQPDDPPNHAPHAPGDVVHFLQYGGRFTVAGVEICGEPRVELPALGSSVLLTGRLGGSGTLTVGEIWLVEDGTTARRLPRDTSKSTAQPLSENRVTLEEVRQQIRARDHDG